MMHIKRSLNGTLELKFCHSNDIMSTYYIYCEADKAEIA